MEDRRKETATEDPSMARAGDGEPSVLVMERLGKIDGHDRSFDIAFWQAQDTTARLNALWELVELHLTLKGRRDELRLQRSVETLQRKRS